MRNHHSDEFTHPDQRTRACIDDNGGRGDHYHGSIVSDVLVKDGPDTAYSEAGPSWADYADMQADPDNNCRFWSLHTLVHNVPDPQQDPQSVDKRDVWLFEIPGNCNNANLNGDGGVDMFDMAMFNDLYSTGARRVDMNTDGTTDAADAAEYADAYDDQKD